jgi:glutamate---cysteine ligase / carboxylate-amine ligase
VRIDFNSSEGPSLGVEWELELIDCETRELASSASEILGELGKGHPDGEHPKAKHELFECTIEIITGICSTVTEARDDLQASLDEVTAQARARDLGVMCSGSHPFSSWYDQTISPNPRYVRLVEEMRWMAERLQIFGVHVHVGVKSPEKVVAIDNALSFYIPHFLALSASSPFWSGHDTGLASSRSKVFEGLPTAGLPEPLTNWTDFERYMETLVSAEAIGTVREVWWDIRPHPDFGTVELRMCDGLPTLSEVTAVAALGQSLVDWLDMMMDRGYTLPTPPTWIVRQNKWRAARHGLEAELIVDEHGKRVHVRDALVELIEELRPAARRLRCDEELERVASVLDRGASYARQRAVVANGGTLLDVVDSLMSELEKDEPIA